MQQCNINLPNTVCVCVLQEFREDVISEWKKAELDVVICPGFACPALPFGSADHVQGALTCDHVYAVPRSNNK